METRVRFLEDGSKALTVLEIRAPQQHPLLRNVEHRLRRLGVNVVHALSRNIGTDVDLTLHVAEFDGAPLSQQRRLEVQTFLLSNASPSETPRPAPPYGNKPRVSKDDARDRESWPG